MTVVDTEYRSTSSPAEGPLASRIPDLAQEHSLLLQQIAVRGEELMAAIRAGRHPAPELDALLGYLRAEIIRQAVEEETRLFPACSDAPGVCRLARDHVRLRAGVEALDLAARAGAGAVAALATTVRDLLRQLEAHFALEEAVLGAGPGGTCGVPATTALGAHPHDWYPLTEGRTIDLDALRADQADAAAAERLLRLGRGEEVELQSSHDPFEVWQRADELAPGGYGFAYLDSGPDRWRVLVTRRELE